MKMAIYYEIYARLTIEPRRNLIEERLKKTLGKLYQVRGLSYVLSLPKRISV